jgi:hypothetical protein
MMVDFSAVQPQSDPMRRWIQSRAASAVDNGAAVEGGDIMQTIAHQVAEVEDSYYGVSYRRAAVMPHIFGTAALACGQLRETPTIYKVPKY